MVTAIDIFNELYRRAVKRYHAPSIACEVLRIALPHTGTPAKASAYARLAETLVDEAEVFWESMRPHFKQKNIIELTCPYCESELCPMYKSLLIGAPLLAVVEKA